MCVVRGCVCVACEPTWNNPVTRWFLVARRSNRLSVARLASAGVGDPQRWFAAHSTGRELYHRESFSRSRVATLVPLDLANVRRTESRRNYVSRASRLRVRRTLLVIRSYVITLILLVTDASCRVARSIDLRKDPLLQTRGGPRSPDDASAATRDADCTLK